MAKTTYNSIKNTPVLAPDWGARGTAGVSFAAALNFNKVDVHLGERKVLDKLDLSVTPGEIVCLLGESGSGKSTLLRVAAGLQRITSGEVRINDKISSSGNFHTPPEHRGVGLMFQDFALFPHMSLLDNVAFGLSSLGKKTAEQQGRLALQRVGLGDRESDFPHALSGGQQQRLALARTIAPRPGILMLDEPFSGLDARMRENVRGETLAVLRETGATSLIVTHDPEEAMLMGDRIALLRKGQIIQIDTASEVYHAPIDLAAARFMSPVSEISGVVINSKVETPLGVVPAANFANGAKVMVAFRPVGALSLAPNNQGVPGRIVSKRNALGVDILEIRVDGVDRPLRIRRQAESQHVAGSDVFVQLNVHDVLVFAAD